MRGRVIQGFVEVGDQLIVLPVVEIGMLEATQRPVRGVRLLFAFIRVHV